MTELEATQRVISELGPQATVAEIVRDARERLGVPLDARFVPLYLATLRGHEQRDQMRLVAAQIALQKDTPEPRTRKS